ncbi:MAG: hypothetical protein ACUVQK_07040 [Thermogutta sp.]
MAFHRAAEEREPLNNHMQWSNPRPGGEIRSIDIRCPEDGRRYGEPAVPAITAARAAP